MKQQLTHEQVIALNKWLVEMFPEAGPEWDGDPYPRKCRMPMSELTEKVEAALGFPTNANNLTTALTCANITYFAKNSKAWKARELEKMREAKEAAAARKRQLWPDVQELLDELRRLKEQDQRNTERILEAIGSLFVEKAKQHGQRAEAADDPVDEGGDSCDREDVPEAVSS